MTKLLASVANLEEALVALEAGVDIIDLKNPAVGALGALPLAVINEIVAVIDGRCPTTATIGDLAMDPKLLVHVAGSLVASGVDVIKIGFFGTDSHHECTKALQPLAKNGLRITAVLFADQKPNFELLLEFKKAGFYGVMLDTANKDIGSLPDYMTQDDLQAFIALARLHGLQSGLSGSLRLEHIPVLTVLKPGFLGFRGALCVNAQRASSISRFKTVEIKELLYKCNKVFGSTLLCSS